MGKKAKPLTRSQTAALWREMLDSTDTLNAWCRKNKVLRSVLITGVRKFFPSEWDAKLPVLGPIHTGVCEYDGLTFYANIGGQRFCAHRCAQAKYAAGNLEYQARRRARQQSVRSRHVEEDSQG